MAAAMAAQFIFMLTRQDRTIEGALERLPEVLAAGVRHIGFKDIGLPLADLHELAAAIRTGGATLYLEMVGLGAASEGASARAAVELQVDVLMGGVCPGVVLPIIAGAPIRYYPFPGEVTGHPSRLTGTVETIAASARDLLAQDGVHGLDLLAYRFAGDVPTLMRHVCAAAGERPVVMAGSIDCADRIGTVIASGAAAFTVGTAALDGAFPTTADLGAQLSFVARAITDLERMVSGASHTRALAR
jgi:4-hydroxythreonine-4-phosphate dehydrogenase